MDSKTSTLEDLRAFAEGERPWKTWAKWRKANALALEALLRQMDLVLIEVRPQRAVARVLHRNHVKYVPSQGFLRASRPVPRPKPPVSSVITDDVLGTLTYNSLTNTYETTIRIGKAKRPVRLSIARDGSLERTCARAREVTRNANAFTTAARDYAVSTLLTLNNTYWLDDHERPLTPDTFRGKLSLQGIHVHSNAHVTYWHDDGDLFFGHAVEVSMNSRDRFFHADIPG